MPDSQEWERHWNTISLGIVTVATAAAGVALFTADVTENCYVLGNVFACG